jgi:predicted GNAT family acetyltransferase
MHRPYSIYYDDMKFYQPEYCPFGATGKKENNIDDIEKYSDVCNNFFVVGTMPSFPSSLRLKQQLICDQMAIDHEIQIHQNDDIIRLGPEHADTLFQLIDLVQPGYFKRKTNLLGDYHGIFKDSKLVAVTGERMQLKDYVEVSAVVTHPSYTGRGYARQLVAHVVNRICEKNKNPFLHVAASNRNAIRLYEQLGFTLRRKMNFWNFISLKQ